MTPGSAAPARALPFALTRQKQDRSDAHVSDMFWQTDDPKLSAIGQWAGKLCREGCRPPTAAMGIGDGAGSGLWEEKISRSFEVGNYEGMLVREIVSQMHHKNNVP